MQLQALLLRVRQTRPTQAERQLTEIQVQVHLMTQAHPAIQVIQQDMVQPFTNFWIMLILKEKLPALNLLHGAASLRIVHVSAPQSFRF